MRIPIAIICAVFITFTLFYIMMGLVRTDDVPLLDTQVPTLVSIERKSEGQDQKTQRVTRIKSPKEEPRPNFDTSKLVTEKANLNNIDVKLKLNLSPIQLNVAQLPRLQQNWIQPSSLDTSTSTEGLDGEITSEPKSMSKITPVGTRMPIIPKVAWDNKINGWVLLSFTVSSEGRVKDIRILDASPKGVFEENAVLAASKWRYQGFIGYDRYVSQKIEFEWKNYPYNWDY
jgi:protein TonB